MYGMNATLADLIRYRDMLEEEVEVERDGARIAMLMGKWDELTDQIVTFVGVTRTVAA